MFTCLNAFVQTTTHCDTFAINLYNLWCPSSHTAHKFPELIIRSIWSFACVLTTAQLPLLLHPTSTVSTLRLLQQPQWKSQTPAVITAAVHPSYFVTACDPLLQQHCKSGYDYVDCSTDGIISKPLLNSINGSCQFLRSFLCTAF